MHLIFSTVGTCDDGVLNQDETSIDQGGVCGTTPTCDDGILNQDETSIDQGGVCDTTPPAGKLYTSTNSCIYAFLYVPKKNFCQRGH